jgi:hypothetical protein
LTTILIDLFRHKLVHLAQPSPLIRYGSEVITWRHHHHNRQFHLKKIPHEHGSETGDVPLDWHIQVTHGITMAQRFKIVRICRPNMNWQSIRLVKQLLQNDGVPFGKEHKHMLAHAKVLMEYRNGYVAIHPRYNKLITALRTAVENSEGMLDKDATSFGEKSDTTS